MLTIIVTWYNCNFTLDTLVDARRAHYQYIINSRFTNQQQCIGEVHWCIGACTSRPHHSPLVPLITASEKAKDSTLYSRDFA